MDDLKKYMTSSINILEVQSSKTLNDTKSIFHTAMNIGNLMFDNFMEYWDRLFFEKIFKSYIAYDNDIPVAIGTLLLDENLAGIYAVGTIPEYRRKGIGTHMTAYLIQEAKKKYGYNTCILQATEMGFPVYTKIGFKTVFHVVSFHLNIK